MAVNVWGIKTGYIVSWTVEREYKRNSSRLVYRKAKGYEKYFITPEEVIKFIQKKTKEWNSKGIHNSLFIKHVDTNEQWMVNPLVDKNMQEWAEKNGFIQ